MCNGELSKRKNWLKENNLRKTNLQANGKISLYIYCITFCMRVLSLLMGTISWKPPIVSYKPLSEEFFFYDNSVGDWYLRFCDWWLVLVFWDCQFWIADDCLMTNFQFLIIRFGVRKFANATPHSRDVQKSDKRIIKNQTILLDTT